MREWFARARRWLPLSLALTWGVILTATLLGPQERTLGNNLPLVMLHGAWVWAGKLVFAAAGLAGAWALITRRPAVQALSLALGRCGLIYWLTYLPMSLVVQQVNWGGIYWDEPRWQIPLAFGVVGLLLQVGLSLLEQPALTCAANLAYAVALWWQLGGISSVLHPDSPVFGSGAAIIEVYFMVLLALLLISAAQVTGLLLPKPSAGAAAAAGEPSAA